MEKYLPFYLKFDEISREKNGPIRWRKSVQVGPKIFSSALGLTLELFMEPGPEIRIFTNRFV